MTRNSSKYDTVSLSSLSTTTDYSPAPARVSPSIRSSFADSSEYGSNSLPLDYRLVQIQASKFQVDMRYDQVRFLSRGAYGFVTQAIDMESNFCVVLKMVNHDDPKDWENSVRILREVYYLSCISHPHICSLMDLFPASPSNGSFSHLFLVSPFYAGGTLSQYKVQRMTDVAHILCQILLAIEFLHKNGILHRDIKKENIFVSNGFDKVPHVVLGDLGLSRHRKRIMTNEIVTASYRAPCLLLGVENYGPEIDLYAVGCVFFELIALPANECLYRDIDESGGLSSHIAERLAMSLVRKNDESFIFDSFLSHHACKNSFDLQTIRKDVDAKSFANDRWGDFYSGVRNITRNGFCEIAPRDFETIKELASSLAERLLAFNVSERISVSDALSDPFFQELGVAVEKLRQSTERNSSYTGIVEDFDERLQKLSDDVSRGEALKDALWAMIRNIPQRQAQLPMDLGVVYPNEKLRESTLNKEPISTRTRSQKRRKYCDLPFLLR